MDKIAFIFNPSSGRGKSLKKRRWIESELKKQGMEYQWFTSKSAKHLKKLARKATKEFPVVVAVGGDTTFQIVASELLSVKTTAAMGMLGTGSTNDITRGLGIQGVKKLCKAVRSGNTRQMDVGILEIPGKKPSFFLGVLSLGMGAEVNRYMSEFWARHPILRKGGNWLQTIAGIRGIRDCFRRNIIPATIRIQADGMDEWVDYALIAFTNINFYAGGINLTPDITPFDGLIGCCILQSRNTRQTVSAAWYAHRGKHKDHPYTKLLSGTSYLVNSEDPVRVQFDGELSQPTHEFRISVKPSALKIVG
jgi:diacylglycerol kinase (ATP)